MGWLLLLLAVGLSSALPSSVPAIRRNMDPYATFVDASPQAEAGTRRNYFFGPGYQQLRVIVKEAAAGQMAQLARWKRWRDTAWDKVHDAAGWVEEFGVVLLVAVEVLGAGAVWGIYGILVFASGALGFICIGAISGLLYAGFTVVMVGFFIVFSTLWLVDRALLGLRSIHSRCPTCKRLFVVPLFVCPTCGQQHRNLTPGPYGVTHRTCTCGTKLATMYLTGRSRYEARCPHCTSAVAASDAQQFGIQLVGTTASGKSAFLAAFWHAWLSRAAGIPNLAIQAAPPEAFEALEEWFRNGEAPATSELNSPMYSVVHTLPDKTPVQMTIYDVAGEAFFYESLEVRQEQFGYCEGIVFAIDVTGDPQDSATAIINFAQEFTALTGKHASKLARVPVAVMITKADLFKRDIGLPRTKAIFHKDPSPYAESDGTVTLDHVRNGICREFLSSRGFDAVMNLLDSHFGTLQLYAVSAIGHEPRAGAAYEPWGVLEPVGWLMQQDGGELVELLPTLLVNELSGAPQIKRPMIPLPWRGAGFVDH